MIAKEWEGGGRGPARRLLLGLLLLASLGTAQGASIWVVEGEGGFLLGGSLHVLRPGDFPLPSSYEAAYQATEVLVLETDPTGSPQSPAVQQLLQQLGFYDKGERVQAVLSPASWQRLQAFIETRDLNLALLEQMRPAMLMLTLSNIELMAHGVTELGLDGYFFQRARAQGRPWVPLESVEQQLRLLLSLGEDDPDAYIRAGLDEIDRSVALLPESIELWRDGDYEALFERLVAPGIEAYPASYQAVIVERHRAWLPTLHRFADSERQELVLVGAAHLGGPHGLLKQLREAGYRVQPWPSPAP